MCGKYKKHKLYDIDSGSVQQLHSQSSPGDLAVAEGQRNGNFSLSGKLGHSCARVTKSRHYDSQIRDHVVVHLRRFKCKQCVVDGSVCG